GPDNRLGIYLGDSWKVKPNLTLTYGVRYVRDTGRNDSDLPGIPALNAALPGYGNPIQQPNGNLGPQVGLAWDPKSDGKTVIRAGIGEYFENVIYNNVLFDRPVRLQKGGFLASPFACAFGPSQVPWPDGSTKYFGGSKANATALCTSAIGSPDAFDPSNPNATVAQGLADFEKQYQAAQAAAGLNNPNPNDIENLLKTGSAIPLGLFAPGYKTPRSIQMNAGFQRELHPGTVLSADYVRNVSLHYLLGVDVNHTGDAAFLNMAGAQNAIATTLAACGAANISAAAAPGGCLPLHPIGPGSNGAANITDFAANGLDSPGDIVGGGSCVAALGTPCAFSGINPNVGTAPFLE
ncbi:MAG: TonB-dependent receptor, partial [Blastocatellia bacterium]